MQLLISIFCANHLTREEAVVLPLRPPPYLGNFPKFHYFFWRLPSVEFKERGLLDPCLTLVGPVQAGPGYIECSSLEHILASTLYVPLSSISLANHCIHLFPLHIPGGRMKNILRLHITLEHHTEQTLISQLPLLSADYWVQSTKYWVMQCTLTYHWATALSSPSLHSIVGLRGALAEWELGMWSKQPTAKQTNIYLFDQPFELDSTS